MDLNISQKQAVTCSLGTTLVIAGPGSGKTHVIINRLHYMTSHLNCLPQHILVVTFSKLAAEEMKERYIKQYGHSLITFGTLHSVFYRILRHAMPKRYSLDALLLEDKKKSLLQYLLKDMESEEGEEFLDGFMKHLSLMQNQLISPQHYYPDGIAKDVFLELLKRYEAYKERHNLFDFDDMLVACYHLLKNDSAILKAVRAQFQYILIDEFQDINFVQFEIIRAIATGNKQLFVVGDDDQSIYQFRGAKPSFLLDFEKYFPDTKKLCLNINYRSSQHILQYALALISENQNRFQKDLSTVNPKGLLPQIITCADTKEEALHVIHTITQRKSEGIPLNDMAIIYRTNLQARPIVETLFAANIPFCLRDGMTSLYEQWITQDILCYLHLADNINQPSLALRIMNKPKRYISHATIRQISEMEGHFFMNLLSLETLSEWQKNYIQQLLFDLQVLKEKSPYEAIQYIRQQIGYDQYIIDYVAYRRMQVDSLFEVLAELEDSAKEYASYVEWECHLKEISSKVKAELKQKKHPHEALTLTTMHGAKGLEFNTVFIVDAVDGTIPHYKSKTPFELEEERRLFYVAITRAKRCLFIYLPKQKHDKDVSPSPFIDQIKIRLVEGKQKVGANIYHKSLGKGRIIEVLENNIIQIKFNNGQVRKIDSHYCIKNDIISWEDENDE